MKSYVFLLLFGTLSVAVAQEYDRTDTTLDVLHYRLLLKPDIETGLLRGECRLRFRAHSRPLDSIVLDAREMEIESVSLSEYPETRFRYDGAKIAVYPSAAIESGTGSTLEIVYSARPQKGMYFVNPNASFPNAPRQFYTHSQPDDARYWFPGHDVPWDKAIFDIIVECDSGLDVAANGELVSSTVLSHGFRQWHFQMAQPMSTYLAAVAGGKFHRIDFSESDTPLLEGWAPPETPDDIIEATYGSTADMLRFFEEYTGIRYPWSKYLQVPLHGFPYGGMENQSATFLAGDQVLFDARTRENYDDQHLIAHELAHQWWGDLATCYDWEDLWINEGFATYFQQLWTREALGTDAYDYQRFEGIENIIRYLDGEAPLTVRAHKKNAPQNLYSKGAAILSMVSDIIGEEQFRKAVHNTLKKYGYGSITTRGLQKELEAVSGLVLNEFFYCWLDRSDYPIVEITPQWNEAEGVFGLRLHQRSSDNPPDLRPFYIPLSFNYPDGERSLVLFTTPDTLLLYQMDEPPLFTEVGRMVPMKVELHETPEALIAKLESSESITARIVAARTLGQLLRLPDVQQVLFEAGRRDPFQGVRFEVVHALSELPLEGADLREEVVAFFNDCLRDPQARIRATAINALSRLRDPDNEGLFRDAMDDPSYHVEAAALNALLMLEPGDAEELLRLQLSKESYKDILRTSAVKQVAAYHHVALLPAVTKLATPGNALKLRFEAVKVLVQLGSEYEFFPLLESMLEEPSADVRYLAISALVARYPERAKEVFEKHLPREENRALEMLLQEFIDGKQ